MKELVNLDYQTSIILAWAIITSTVCASSVSLSSYQREYFLSAVL